jgi:hypothetical protein
MTDLTFTEMVDHLTKEHEVPLQRDTGTTMVLEDGLLPMLREAIFLGMEHGSGGGFGSRPPMDAGAVDLLEEITSQAAEVLAAVDRRPTPFGHVEEYVRLWSGLVNESSRVRVSSRRLSQPVPPALPRVFLEVRELTAFRLVRLWYSRVREFFEPPRFREISAACPLCGVRYVFRRVDGVVVRSSVLRFVLDGGSDSVRAECVSCGGVWLPDRFLFLGQLLAEQERTEVA